MRWEFKREERKKEEEGEKSVGETKDALSHGRSGTGVSLSFPLFFYSFRPCEVLNPESWHKQLHSHGKQWPEPYSLAFWH